jgi:UDP-N-acetylmuramate dehydrogenase
MRSEDIKILLKELSYIKDLILRTDEPLNKHTSFQLGGNADYFCVIQNLEQLRRVFNICSKKYNIFILGNGTNILFSDEGYRGVVVKLSGEFKKIEVLSEVIRAGSSISLASLLKNALMNELSGLEFAWGIPGTLGGSIISNAGAFGLEICNLIKNLKNFDFSGEIHEILPEKLDFGYRYCKLPINGLILEVDLQLRKSSRERIENTMKKNIKWRKKNQPLKAKTAGCIFKNPGYISAAKLIESVGLKGRVINGARFSPKHANFIENFNNAKSRDVYELIQLAKETVYKEFGIVLETEINLVGF